MTKYSKNIAIIAHHKTILKDNEYFALMVTDENNRPRRPKSDYFDFDKAWVGLECTSKKEIYISTRFYSLYSLHRGETLVVHVKDTSQCYILN